MQFSNEWLLKAPHNKINITWDTEGATFETKKWAIAIVYYKIAVIWNYSAELDVTESTASVLH